MQDFTNKGLSQAGLNVIPSQGNFLYVQLHTEEEKELLFKKLFDNHVLVCDLKFFGLEKSLRIGIGNRRANIQMTSCLVANI